MNNPAPNFSQPPTPDSSLSDLSNLPAQSTPHPGAPASAMPQPSPSAPPREIKGPIQEVKYVAKDVVSGLFDLAGLNSFLLPKSNDSPEVAAKRRNLHSRWQGFTQQQQQIALQKTNQYRQELAQQRDEQLTRPAPGQQSDQLGGGSTSDRERTIDKLRQDRQQLSSAN